MVGCGKVIFWVLSPQRSHLIGALNRLGPTGWPGTYDTAAGAVGVGKWGDVFTEDGDYLRVILQVAGILFGHFFFYNPFPFRVITI